YQSLSACTCAVMLIFFFEQQPAYEMLPSLEFSRVLFRSPSASPGAADESGATPAPGDAEGGVDASQGEAQATDSDGSWEAAAARAEERRGGKGGGGRRGTTEWDEWVNGGLRWRLAAYTME